MIEVETMATEGDGAHFCVRATEAMRVEVTVNDGHVVAFAYAGAEPDLDQDFDVMFDTADGYPAGRVERAEGAVSLATKQYILAVMEMHDNWNNGIPSDVQRLMEEWYHEVTNQVVTT